MTYIVITVAVAVAIIMALFLLTPTKNSDTLILKSVFFQVILGLEHKKPQGIAHHWVLMIGFLLEAIVLYSTLDVIISQWILDKIFLGVIIFSLIFHQILIFRNFSVAEHGENNTTTQEYDNRYYKSLKIVLTFITFCIFIGISAVAGEFGYLFAVSKLSHIGDNGGLISDFIGFMEINPEKIVSRFTRIYNRTEDINDMVILKYALKSLFVAGAGLLCCLVIIWDIIVKLLPSEHKKFEEVWLFFIAMDILSLLIWIYVSIFVIPADNLFSPEIRDALYNHAPQCFSFIVGIYFISSAWRAKNGYLRLKNTQDETCKVAL